MSVVGIDLGTTNTVAACVRSGKVHVLADEQGTRLLPSVVSFHPNGEVLVGGAAKARRVIDAKNTVYSHKRLIGRSWGSPEIMQAKKRFAFELKEGPGQGPLVHARNQDYTLPEISAFVLKRARQIAETALGTPVERAVITVPAHFNELQRASTKVAGRVSGLEVLRILNEPTAAALAYGLGRTGSERVAVYDFGGGTFDCTLLDLNGNVFEVLATAGDSFLGGDDVDGMIAERMAETFLKQHRYDPRSDMQMLERLRTSAEEVKIALSTAEAHAVSMKDFGFGAGGAALTFNFTMTRGDLEAMMAPLLERTFKVTQDALSLARLTPTGFDKVILVGGSTRIPVVRKRVEAFFGAPPMDRVNPDEVVAIGAAIQAAALTEGTRKRNIPAPPPVPAGHARTMPGVADAADPTFTSELDANKLKPAFGSEPPSFGFGTRSSNPPAIVGDPRKITNPGLAPTTQPMGARAPGAAQTPGQRAAADEEPSIASFPDLAVPTPLEWFPSSGETQVKGPATSERSFGGNTITKAVDGTLPNQGPGFGAIDEPPSLYSTPSASVPSFPSLSSQSSTHGSPQIKMPSPLGDTLASPVAAEGFGAVRDLSLVSTSGVSSPGAPTQEDGPFGHLPDLSLVSTTGAMPNAPNDPSNDAIANARRKAVEGGLFSDATDAIRRPAPGPSGPAALQTADDSADLPAVVRDADLPSLPARKKPEIRKTSPGMAASGGSPMIGKPPPAVAPQPFGPMEKIDDTLAMQGRPQKPATSTARAPGGVRPPPAPVSTSPMPARPPPLNTTMPLAATPQPRTPASQPQVAAARPAPSPATTQPLSALTPNAPPPFASSPPPGHAPPPYAAYGSAPPPGPGQMPPPTATAPFGSVSPGGFGSAPPGMFGSVPPGGHNINNVPTAPPPPPIATAQLPPAQAQLPGGQPVFGAYASAPPPALDQGREMDPQAAAAPPAVRYASPVLVDVTPRGLVVETAGGYTDTIIPRNSKIPCERTRRFATGRDMQTSVRVRVAQGEHQHFPQNTYLGEVELSGLRPAARGEVVVAVTFEVDADGTLRVRARDVQTGQEARAVLQLIGVADESSVVMMINRFANQPVVGGPTH